MERGSIFMKKLRANVVGINTYIQMLTFRVITLHIVKGNELSFHSKRQCVNKRVYPNYIGSLIYYGVIRSLREGHTSIFSLQNTYQVIIRLRRNKPETDTYLFRSVDNPLWVHSINL